jgi:ABC-type transport system involved in multi-copper enzyme maturation permease subunit
MLLIALVGGIAIGTTVSFIHHNRNLAAAHARAERQARQLTNQVQGAQGPEAPGSAVGGSSSGEVCKPGPPGAPSVCVPSSGPTAQQLYVDPRFFFARAVPGWAAAGAITAGLISLILGASGIGAEWSAGTFSFLLTFRPRRLRVLTAKLTAVALLACAIATVTVALLFGLAWIIAATRGSMAGSTSSVVTGAILRGVRGVGIAGLLGLIGAALAGLTRSTAAALGGVGAYLVGGEMVLSHLRPHWVGWFLGPNIGAAVGGHLETLDNRVLHAGHGFLVVGGCTAALVAISAYLLVRRDVT